MTLVNKFVKKFVIDKQKTNKQTDKQTAVFIDMPPACKNIRSIHAVIFI